MIMIFGNPQKTFSVTHVTENWRCAAWWTRFTIKTGRFGCHLGWTEPSYSLTSDPSRQTIFLLMPFLTCNCLLNCLFLMLQALAPLNLTNIFFLFFYHWTKYWTFYFIIWTSFCIYSLEEAPDVSLFPFTGSWLNIWFNFPLLIFLYW